MIKQVFTGHLCSVGAGVYWSSVQCWSDHWAVFKQVFTGHLGGVHWASGRCSLVTRAGVHWASVQCWSRCLHHLGSVGTGVYW